MFKYYSITENCVFFKYLSDKKKFSKMNTSLYMQQDIRMTNK